MSDYTKLPRDIADCMKRAGAELSEDQQILLAGYLGPVQEQLEQAQADRDKHRNALESIEWLILRKQAEAVEVAVEQSIEHLKECAWPQGGIPDDASHALEEVEGHAQRLRTQADELEQNQ